MSDFNKAVKAAEVKSTFNDSVDKAKGLPENPGLINFPVKPQTPQIEYRVPGEYFQDVWPTSFKFMPKVGDKVEAQSGATLKITDITHRVGGRVLITLRRDLGGSSGTSGGGGGAESDPF